MATTMHAPDRNSDAWLADVKRWVGDRLAESGLGKALAFERIRHRPWSTVLRVTTESSRVFFKAAGPGGRHEPALLATLAELAPDLVPRLLATDDERGWMLTGDGGDLLRERAAGADSLATWARLLPRYADLQLRSAASVESLLRMRVPDRRLVRIPGALEDALNDPSLSNPLAGASSALRARALAELPQLARACRSVAALPLPDALDHGDLHGGNVLVDGEEIRLCDWGDASVTHPFCSLLTVLQTVLPDVAAGDRARAAMRLRDAYLEPFASLAPKSVLMTCFADALALGYVVRILDWVHMLQGADDEAIAHWRPYAEATLTRWADLGDSNDREDDSLLALFG